MVGESAPKGAYLTLWLARAEGGLDLGMKSGTKFRTSALGLWLGPISMRPDGSSRLRKSSFSEEIITMNLLSGQLLRR